MKSPDGPYARGLHQVDDLCWAWLEPDGSWGYSNAGVITGDSESLVVDTLFDLRMARDFLAAAAEITAERPIRTVVNTHANGDHFYGNQLLADATIVTSEACAKEMASATPQGLIALQQAPGPLGRFASEIFSPFDFTGIVPTLPSKTFSGSLTLNVGGTQVDLHELGPAHTEGDIIAHVPATGTVYTGDLLFIGGTPVNWAGPLSNCLRACQFMLDLDAETYVPGHGPITDRSGIKVVMDYLSFVEEEAGRRCAGGMSAQDAVHDIDLGRFAGLGERGRLAQNVLLVYYEKAPEMQRLTASDVFGLMAELEGWV